MAFNSLDFAIFLPIVFLIYWLVLPKNLRIQNLFLLAASYTFYGWWDPRFLALILTNSVVDFLVGRKMATEASKTKRKLLLAVSITVNLGLLGFFKYCNFFIDSAVDAFSLFGTSLNAGTLQIVLPVGISFYTFQTLSYTIDIYKKKIEPTSDPIAFFAFLSFFPQLVAGPIERASNLLPQFLKKRSFSYEKAADGCRQIAFGLFKKIVIADNCAHLVDKVFASPEAYSAGSLLVGAMLFAIQIYADFSGYSDIAIGTARLLGFKLMQNFAYPYFARDIAEFWRRWHISLTTWFRDYVYIPLGGSRASNFVKFRNILIVFLVSGFWHGAKWTFLAWGLVHALLFLPLMFAGVNRKHLGEIKAGSSSALKTVFQVLTTFMLVSLAWVFFRAESIGDAFVYFKHLFSTSILSFPNILKEKQAIVIGPIVFMFIVEWFGRNKAHGFELRNLRPILRRALYLLVFVATFLIGDFGNSDFIYFQF